MRSLIFSFPSSSLFLLPSHISCLLHPLALTCSPILIHFSLSSPTAQFPLDCRIQSITQTIVSIYHTVDRTLAGWTAANAKSRSPPPRTASAPLRGHLSTPDIVCIDGTVASPPRVSPSGKIRSWRLVLLAFSMRQRA